MQTEFNIFAGNTFHFLQIFFPVEWISKLISAHIWNLPQKDIVTILYMDYQIDLFEILEIHVCIQIWDNWCLISQGCLILK